MARKFMIDYESGPYGAYFSREEFFILVHYAMRLNPILGEKFYFAGETEYIYRHEKNIPMEGLEYDESNTPYWNTVALSEVIKFIIDQLIPSLESETVDDMILILGGWENLQAKIDQGPAFVKRFGLISAENKIFTELYNYTYFSKSFMDVINHALLLGEPYTISYNE